MTEYVKVTIEADACGRLSIGCQNEAGYGHGYRLAGPKFCGCHPGESKIVAELDEEDVKQIRLYLKVWDEIQAQKAVPA